MTDSNRYLVISDNNQQTVQDSDEDDECHWYIDENVFDSMTDYTKKSTKSTNTGNPFELDPILLASMNRYQTRSSQTVLTSNTNILVKRHRSTVCQAEYFATRTEEINTDQEQHEEDRIIVMKKLTIENKELLLSIPN